MCWEVNPADPTTIPKYVDPLPIPPVARPVEMCNGVPVYRVKMVEVKRRLHRCFPKTTVWAYNGEYPGPTFDVRSGEPVIVEWLNRLPEKHFLPIDTTVHGAEPDQPEVRTVVHLHGGNTPSAFDGYPEAWWTPFEEQAGPFYETNVYRYGNQENATTLWYHDHALGITRLNVYAGLAGFYLVRDSFEESLNLPRGRYEVPLIIQDRSFDEDGSLFYPAPCINGVEPSILPGVTFETILVNGKVWPFLEVEPRKYRFRLLNGSNTRSYELKLSNGQEFIQIGTDGGFLERPIHVDRLVLFPAERIDLILDFSDLAGKTITLLNTAAGADPGTTGQVMQFRVVLPLRRADRSRVPDRFRPIERFSPKSALARRDITLVEPTDQFGRPMPLLEAVRWEDPISISPRLGTVEIWRLINLTDFTHPIHVHLIEFHILDRRPFDVAEYHRSGQLRFTGEPISPEPFERGWKDVVQAPGGFVTRIIMRWGDYTGHYPIHCHILEHEDHEMMRPFLVVGPEPNLGAHSHLGGGGRGSH